MNNETVTRQSKSLPNVGGYETKKRTKKKPFSYSALIDICRKVYKNNIKTVDGLFREAKSVCFL